VHPRGQGLAGPVPVEAVDAILAYPNNAGVPLAGCCANAALSAKELVAHPPRVMRRRIDGLAGLTHDIREVRLAIEAGGPFDFIAGQYAEIEFAPGLPGYDSNGEHASGRQTGVPTPPGQGYGTAQYPRRRFFCQPLGR
jgi:hypothetical protein